LEKYLPNVLQWIRESRFPLIAILVSIPYVNARLNAFANVDLADPVNYRNYVGCNYIGTLWANFIIGLCFFYLLKILFPLVGFAFYLLANLFALLYRDYLLLANMLIDMQVSAAMAPLIIAGYVDTPVPQHVKEETYVPDAEELAQERQPLRSRRGMQQQQPHHLGKGVRRVGSMANLQNMLQRAWDNLVGTRKNK
jgi:hypothetical protein